MSIQPYEGSEKYIFVSYAHKDKETVLPILEKLRARGCRIWCDDKLIVGENYNAAIARHLRECDAVLFFLSENWMLSDYCRSEATVGIEQFQKKVALLYLESCTTHDEVLMLFAGKHTLRKNDPQYLDKLLNSPALRDCIGQAEIVTERKASEGLKYELDINGTYAVTGLGTCKDTDIVIPSTYQGKPVTSIGDKAFYCCKALTSITIPNSVTSIGNEAFFSCTSLTSINVPERVTSIGNNTFSGCLSLESIAVSEGNSHYRSYESHLYSKDMRTLITYAPGCKERHFTIPNSVTSIRSKAFAWCTALSSISVPSSVTSIEASAFHGCSSLTSVTLPNSVVGIGDSAFEYCEALTSIIIPIGVTSIGNEMFSGCESLTSIIIPNSVTSIAFSAFSSCKALTTIYYSGAKNDWTKIRLGNYWNSNCPTITVCCTNGTITIHDPSTELTPSEGLEYVLSEDGSSYSVKKIGNCKDTEIVIPRTYQGKPVTSIGEQAFYERKFLTSITIPNSVTSIGKSAFCRCYSLTSITIPDSVTSIGDWAFDECEFLTSITIPDSVTSIGNNAFSWCLSLESIAVSEGNSHYRSYESHLYTKDMKTLVSYAPGCQDTHFTIPNSVTSIGKSAFYKCESLTSITIPDSVTSIGGWAFYKCKSLTSITIPNSVTSIGEHAFVGCTSLTSITIPDSVTSIGDGAFEECKSLTSITIPDSVTSIGYKAFYSCSSLTSITIPDSVTSIGDSAFDRCKALTSIIVSEGNPQYRSYESHLYSKDMKTFVRYAPGCKDTHFTIPDSVTSIGDGAFNWCKSLTGITIPDSVTSIGKSAFSVCSSLPSITIPNSATSIGNFAFSWCEFLTTIYYSGAQNDWTKIQLGFWWNSNCPAITVHCTDGTIKIPKGPHI